MDILQIRNGDGSWSNIPAITGPKGKDGKDYVLTEQDKQEIANIVLSLIPSGEGVKY